MAKDGTNRGGAHIGAGATPLADKIAEGNPGKRTLTAVKYSENFTGTTERTSSAIATDGIDEELMELQKELVKKANNKKVYDEIADQIFALKEKRHQFSFDMTAR